MRVAPLPKTVIELCNDLNAPPRLVAHLSLVHDTATRLVEAFAGKWPTLNFDAEAVLFGAATHDIGKVLHPNELTGHGNLHERDGPRLLQQHGVSPELARFARTHGQWNEANASIEDLLVALADAVWKGARHESLETRVVEKICESTGDEAWDVFQRLDRIVTRIAKGAPARLEWQRSQE